MSTVLNRKGKEVMGCVILNLSAACARNCHFLGRTIIFEGRGSFLTILKCVQIKNKPICAKQNVSSLSTVEYLNLSRIHYLCSAVLINLLGDVFLSFLPHLSLE